MSGWIRRIWLNAMLLPLSAYFIACQPVADDTLDPLLLAAAVPAPELAVVDSVDLERYSGTWYEVASLPQPFNQGCVCTTATYGALEPGVVSVLNQCRNGTPDGDLRSFQGRAFVQPGTGNAILSVEFFFPFRGPYYIIDLDTENYQWATVGEPFRGALFLLSRTANPASSIVDAQIERARTLGFPVENLRTSIQDGCS